jgi:RNA polymerase sigma-70 factor, ECF subfamily
VTDVGLDIDSPAFLARIQARDAAAIETVVDAYLEQVLRAARGAGLDATAAEDVAQNTFTTFIEKASRFEGRSRVRTWIFGILYHKISESRRAAGRDRPTDDIDRVVDERFTARGGWRSPPRAADRRLEDQEIGEAIRDCLETVPERQRQAFKLREVDEMSTEEICKILDVSRTNLGVMLFRSAIDCGNAWSRKGSRPDDAEVRRGDEVGGQ